MRGKGRIVVLYSFLFLVFAACRTGKGVVNHGRVENLSTNKLIDSIVSHRFSFEYFSSKISADVDAPNFNKSFRINLRMRNDSAIWATLSQASIVGGTALITKDSLKMANKIEKSYLMDSFDYLNEMFRTDLDFRMFEDLIVGNPLAFDPEEKFKSKEDTAFYYLSSAGKRKIKRALEKEKQLKKDAYIFRYWIYPGTFRPARVIINDLADSTSLEVVYGSYQLVDSLVVPENVNIIASSPRGKALIELKYKSVKVNEFLEFPFNIPEGYVPME